jgi:putative tricarboxylic transport membrane protein
MVSIRAPKDFWAGVMFIAFAAVALYVSRNYSLGTAIRMGPGYFPMLLGGVLAVIGAILVVRSLVITGDPIGEVRVLPLVVIAVAVVLFGVLLPKLGLAVTLPLVIAISALASAESRRWQVLLLALVLTAFSALVFVYGLRLPIPLWPTF